MGHREVKKRMRALTREVLYDLYVQQEKSLGDIADMYRCSRTAVYNRLEKFGILARNKSQARAIALEQEKFEGKQGKHFDETFFTHWSNAMAWVLGLFFTDGCMQDHATSKAVSLSQKEPELLEKVLDLMGCDAKIYDCQERAPTFTLNGDLVYNQLTNLGLTPRKSLNMQFPDIPELYIRHFIRGCWDGDGSVFYAVERDSIRASYVCGSLSFITSTAVELKKAGLPERTIYHDPERHIYSIRFNGEKQCYQLFHYLYDDVPETQYLERKYRRFKNFFDNHPIGDPRSCKKKREKR